ncbi:hypothetical protein [Chromobacterium sp. IIBBL 290-4]|uniref:hypothetical protein n=1 Tax=Chromobacterium sp. IIBBL 290-4 TaxID=2953890 RepID=UPI0020B7EF8C|nr:hypothetical protein [Chromobacterium sp. IIBBL 290-4]UTH75692.1 hypothetical protein NKT35_06225 [Chromobacterium sp. IIBBL 290-4]
MSKLIFNAECIANISTFNQCAYIANIENHCINGILLLRQKENISNSDKNAEQKNHTIVPACSCQPVRKRPVYSRARPRPSGLSLLKTGNAPSHPLPQNAALETAAKENGQPPAGRCPFSFAPA